MPFVPAYEGQFPSLGLQVAEHIEHYLGLELMREQAERLVRLYRLDVRGKRVVRRAALRRPKGAGKSPEGGYCGFAELTGPVIFAGWDANGQPVGRRRDSRTYAGENFPWVQFAAVSEDQTDNISVWLYETLKDRGDTLDELRIDLGRTRIYLRDEPGRIELVTSAADSREGQPITFAAMDQTEAWFVNNGGVRLAGTLRGNVSKTGGWSYELQNGPEPGMESVAERTARAWVKGQPGLLFDTREPKVMPDLERIKEQVREGQPLHQADVDAMFAALAEVYGESADRGFVDLERQAAEALDSDTSISYASRMYFNVPWAPEDVWIKDRQWDRLAAEVKPEPGEKITAGFSGRLYDGAALVGCRVETGELFVVHTWEKVGELVPRTEVADEVAAMMSRYTVARFYVDLSQWATEYDAWHLAYGDTVVSRPPQQSARWGHACSNLFRPAVIGGELAHDGNTIVRSHVIAARTRKAAAGDLIVPRTDGPADQITGAKAAVLAWEARADVLASAQEDEASVYEERGMVTL